LCLYNVSRIVKRENVRKELKVRSSKLVCICGDDVYWGLPCRHQVAVFVKSTCSFGYLPFNQRWLLNAVEENFEVDPQDLSPSSDQHQVW